MNLSSLIDKLKIDIKFAGSVNNIDITDITTDPTQCSKGVLYVAAEGETVSGSQYGTRMDGKDFIDDALANGASAILSTSLGNNREKNIPYLFSENPLALLGSLCKRLYGEPKPNSLALVTGTNGKTSVVDFTCQIWSSSQVANCSVGNLGGIINDGTIVWERDTVLSVPETVFMHKMLQDLAQRGINHVAMEATSHALYDYRLNDCGAKIGAFTNLTRDHLDFHKSMDEYFRVKMTLFEDVLETGSKVILNADTSYFENALEICKRRKHEILTFGRKGKDIRLVNKVQEESSQKLELEIMGKTFTCNFNLTGEFQISNALCSLGIALSSGISQTDCIKGLSKLKPVEGRLNTVANTLKGGKVLIDFAHTPDGLKKALEACRDVTKGKLTVIFGCNGDRDIGKREEMGIVASQYADNVYVTDGHPRNEDPHKIRKAILGGAQSAREISGRKEAIEFAIAQMEPEETILIAGFGHQQFQIIGAEEIPFSEVSIVNRALMEIDN